MSGTWTKAEMVAMSRALALARRGRRRAAPNPMVGAVILRRGRTVAEGYHAACGAPHAEVAAIRAAGGRAGGATMVVTLEPCGHHGRTPPCAEAIVEAGIAEVIAAVRDPNPVTRGKGPRRLRRAGIPVRFGLMAEEARLLNEAYFHAIETGRPLVTAKWAMSLDGKIATAVGRSKWITCETARRRARRMRGDHDAVAVGIGTVLADDPLLLPEGAGRAARIVIDTRARTPVGSRLVGSAAEGRVVIVVGRAAPAGRRRRLEAAGCEMLVARTRRGRVDLADALKRLATGGTRSMMVEGGAALLGGFFDAGIVDRLAVFVAPTVLGGEGLSAVTGTGVAAPAAAPEFEWRRRTKVGDCLLLEGGRA